MKAHHFLPIVTCLTLLSCSEPSNTETAKSDNHKSDEKPLQTTDNTQAIDTTEEQSLSVKIDPVTNETVFIKTVDGQEIVVDTILPPEAVEILIAESKEPIVDSNYDFHSYENYNALLNSFVSSSGNVNYAGIKANKSDLTTVLKEFKDNYPGSGWTKNQKLCYWINAYNVFTIQLIVDNYPTTSITKITAKPWLKNFVKVGTKTMNLNHIENEIIRKQFNEPRIHFALNCASKSCPVLLNTAYTPSNLESKLLSQTKRFLNDPTKNTFGKKTIEISQLFDWYKTDFTKNGTVIDFINKYRTEKLKSPKITYAEYSWELNK